MSETSSLEKGIQSDRKQYLRFVAGFVFAFAFTLYFWSDGYYARTIGLLTSGFFGYSLYSQYKIFFSPIPALRADSKGIYYKLPYALLFIAWDNIQSIDMITSADTEAFQISKPIMNAQDIATGFPPFWGNYLMSKQLKKIKVLAIEIKNYDALLSQLEGFQRRSMANDGIINKNKIEIPFLRMKCDPDQLLAALKAELEKFQNKT